MLAVHRVTVIVCAVLALVGAAVPTGRAADGGSGTYTVTGRTYYLGAPCGPAAKTRFVVFST